MPWKRNMTISCCYNCPKRHPLCHSDCEDYKAEKEENKKKKQWLKDHDYFTVMKNAEYQRYLNEGKDIKRKHKHR